MAVAPTPIVYLQPVILSVIWDRAIAFVITWDPNGNTGTTPPDYIQIQSKVNSGAFGTDSTRGAPSNSWSFNNGSYGALLTAGGNTITYRLRYVYHGIPGPWSAEVQVAPFDVVGILDPEDGGSVADPEDGGPVKDREIE